MTGAVRSTFGLACPRCGRDDRLAIFIRTWAALSGEGTDADHDVHDWGDDSLCRCEHCSKVAFVAAFHCSKNHKVQS
jgi:hypothetical protein